VAGVRCLCSPSRRPHSASDISRGAFPNIYRKKQSAPALPSAAKPRVVATIDSELLSPRLQPSLRDDGVAAVAHGLGWCSRPHCWQILLQLCPLLFPSTPVSSRQRNGRRGPPVRPSAAERVAAVVESKEARA